jgi:polysaccharide export outer membrane protein
MMIARSVLTAILLTGVVMVSGCGTGRTGGPAPVQSLPGQPATPGEAASSDQGAAAAAQEATNEYRIGPGDVVKISVYNNPDLAMETEVTQGGRISFPLIGEVTLGGLTRGQAEKAISDRLGKGGFVPDAHVNLMVTQYRSRQVSVMGEVNKPGTYSISRATSVAEVLAMACGISQKGGSLVTVIRRTSDGSAQRYELDVRKLLNSGDLSGNGLVDKDDIVFVPAIPRTSTGKLLKSALRASLRGHCGGG